MGERVNETIATVQPLTPRWAKLDMGELGMVESVDRVAVLLPPDLPFHKGLDSKKFNDNHESCIINKSDYNSLPLPAPCNGTQFSLMPH